VRLKAPLLLCVCMCALACCAGRAAAQGVHSEVDARKVGLQEQVILTITVEGSSLPDEVERPALTNLQIVGVPSTSTQFSLVNGRMSQSRSWTYVLQPLAVGPAEVGPVSARIANGNYAAPAIPIEVVPGAVKPAPSQRARDPFDQDPFGTFMQRGRQGEPMMFVEAKPSRPSLYVGEPLLLTYYLYTRSSVSSLQFQNAPEFTGFWAEDLQQGGQPTDEPATVEGVSYHRFAVMKKLLFPTRSGRLVIPPATIAIGVPPQGFFDTGGTVQRSTKPVIVEAKPIPEEPGFSGAVGKFEATSSVDRSNLALGEAATLRFKVEGTGNLKWIDRGPELSVPGAKVFPPQVKSNLEVKPGGITGSRTWEFVVVPQTAGTLEVPSLSFSYFDPDARSVVRSSTRPLELQVQGGVAGAVTPVPMGAPGIAARGGPLPLRTELELPSRWAGEIPGRFVGFAAAAILLLHGLLWGGDALVRLARGGTGRVAAPASVRGALGDLKKVGRDDMSKEAAAGLIEKTIHRVFGAMDGDESERARAVRALLAEVQAVRYAPQLGDYSERLRELATRAGEVMRKWA
jgi:oxygen tolerance protein BatD